MMVMSACVLLGLPVLRPFEEVYKRGLVKPHIPRSFVSFISHQWLSTKHPDPNGDQLRCLQGFLRAASGGRLDHAPW